MGTLFKSERDPTHFVHDSKRPLELGSLQTRAFTA